MSRNKTLEEIRRKRSRRRKRKRQEERKMSTKTLNTKLQAKFKNNLKAATDKFAKELSGERHRSQEHKNKAILYCKKWCSEIKITWAKGIVSRRYP